jgi:hypothetical protein
MAWIVGDGGVLLASKANGEKLLCSISSYKIMLRSFLALSSRSSSRQLLHKAVKS